MPNASSRTRGAGLSAQTSVLFVLMLATVLCIVGLGVDVGAAYSVKSAQKGTLEALSQSCMQQANAVKFSDCPGDEARSQVLEVLEANGFSGAATIWYVEAPASLTGGSDRFAATTVELEQQTDTQFLTVAGLDSLKVVSSESWVTHPYSAEEVFRPADTDDGWTRVTMEAGVIASREDMRVPFQDAPEEIRQMIGSAAAEREQPIED